MIRSRLVPQFWKRHPLKWALLYGGMLGVHIDIDQMGEGGIYIKRPAEFSFDKLESGQDLKAKDALFVGSGSTATLEFDDARIPAVRIHENSIVVIRQPEVPSGNDAKSLEVHIQKGRATVLPKKKVAASRSEKDPVPMVTLRLDEDAPLKIESMAQNSVVEAKGTSLTSVLPPGFAASAARAAPTFAPAPTPAPLSAPPAKPLNITSPQQKVSASRSENSAKIAKAQPVPVAAKPAELPATQATQKPQPPMQDTALPPQPRWSVGLNAGMLLSLVNESGSLGVLQSYALPSDFSLQARYSSDRWSSQILMGDSFASYPTDAASARSKLRGYFSSEGQFFSGPFGVGLNYTVRPYALQISSSVYDWQTFPSVTLKLLWRKIFYFKDVSAKGVGLWLMEWNLGLDFPFWNKITDTVSSIGWGAEAALQGWAPALKFSKATHFRYGPALKLSYVRISGGGFSGSYSDSTVALCGRLDF